MSLSNALRASQGQRAATAGVHGPWLPQAIAQVAAGYYWLAVSATGHGTALFTVPEGNGNVAFNLPQVTVATQPTVLTENGGTQFRMRRAADANPSWLATAGTVQAGWTGPTYLAAWVRLPDAAGDVTGSGTLLGHFLATGNQRRLSWSLLSTTTPDSVSSTNSVDGAVTTGLTTRWGPQPLAGAAWHWLEWVFDPALTLPAQTGDGSGVANKLKLYADFADQVRILDNVVDQTAVFNALAAIQVMSRSGNLANVDTTDWATCYYANGIPSRENREALMRHLAPA